MLRLNCKVQNYAWGRTGSHSLVAQIEASNLNCAIEEGKPYAEYWMGDHVNGPSCVKIDAGDQELSDLIGHPDFVQAND